MAGDLLTPVALYLKIRDTFQGPLLLESSDYRGGENGSSIITCNPIASCAFRGIYAQITINNENTEADASLETLRAFFNSFQFDQGVKGAKNGLFGYSTYDAVQYFESITFNDSKSGTAEIPELIYSLYEYVITINHTRHEMVITYNSFAEIEDPSPAFEKILKILRATIPTSSRFQTKGEEISYQGEQEFINTVTLLKENIQKGDIFQVVPSRKFSQRYEGDDFTLYRALRIVNPSPYLFYFAYGDFTLFGSSPEAQLIIEDSVATVNPIAGTYRRTGDDIIDHDAAQRLKADPKENAEHVMLVDLARNDLSRFCNNVEVSQYREIQIYSHVIHLVSKVTGKILEGVQSLDIFAACLPAGTVSGAPKYRAMELIDSVEPTKRQFYAGTVGFFEPNGNAVHAIVIRSFLSQDSTLSYQAGAGIVADSDPVSELQEIQNKLGALRGAIEIAKEIV